MADFEGSYHKQVTVNAPVDTALAAFGDLDTIVSNYSDLESSSKVDDQTLRFRLKEQNVGVASFQGHYDCRYVIKGNTLTWGTVGSGHNMAVEGTATFTAASPTTTTVDYQERIRVTIDVNRITAKMLRPIVEGLISHGIGDYVKLMRKSAESRS